jgi:hypothetical protein
LATPGFLENGIDFEQLVYYYLTNNYRIEITDPAEVKLATALMEHIINTSHGYDDEDSFAKTIHGRFQMIFNSTLQEIVAREKGGLTKLSNAVWLLDGSYEKGTDFRSSEGIEIETKVYKNVTSMNNYAKKGSVEYTVFHGAEYVLCYLINSHEGKHWYWLKKVSGVYSIYSNEELDKLTSECPPKAISICYCKLRDNKFVIGKNTYCA